MLHIQLTTHLLDVKYQTNSDPTSRLVNNLKLQKLTRKRKGFDHDHIQRRKGNLRLLEESTFSILDQIKRRADEKKIEFQILSYQSLTYDN